MSLMTGAKITGRLHHRQTHLSRLKTRNCNSFDSGKRGLVTTLPIPARLRSDRQATKPDHPATSRKSIRIVYWGKRKIILDEGRSKAPWSTALRRARNAYKN